MSSTFPTPAPPVVDEVSRRTQWADCPIRWPRPEDVVHAPAPHVENATVCEVASGEPLEDYPLWIVDRVKHQVPVTCQDCLELVHA
jgi:hypothetical protein